MGMLDGLTAKLEGLTEDTKRTLKERERQQWEYAWRGEYEKSTPSGTHNVFDMLELYGSRRWELVTVTPNNVWVFKRPKLTETDDG